MEIVVCIGLYTLIVMYARKEEEWSVCWVQKFQGNALGTISLHFSGTYNIIYSMLQPIKIVYNALHYVTLKVFVSSLEHSVKS